MHVIPCFDWLVISSGIQVCERSHDYNGLQIMLGLLFYGEVPVLYVFPCFHWSILLVLQACERGHVDDNGSEASAETNTVDSGKGSSVSDVMSRDLGKHQTRVKLYKRVFMLNSTKHEIQTNVDIKIDRIHGNFEILGLIISFKSHLTLS